MKKNCCWVNCKRVVIHNQILPLEIKMKVVLDLSNYANKKELEHVSGIDTSNLAAKNNFIALKAEVDRLDNNKLVMFHLTGIVSKQKIYDLDLGDLKEVSK